MNGKSSLVYLAILIFGYFAAVSFADDSAIQLAPDVSVHRLTSNIWIHTSIRRYPGGVLTPSNGLIEEDSGSCILIDTAWNDEQTERIYDWAADKLHKPVRLAIVTHAHDDRIGGAGFLLSHGISVMGLKMTGDIAKSRNVPGPQNLFDLTLGQTTQMKDLEIFYPGPGHAPDNIVVWFPAQHVLFGGCLIKSAEAKDLGFIGDADLNHWPDAVKAVKNRYPSAEIVVPGHGNPGGLELTDHTIDLLAKAAAATRPSDPELLH